MAEGVKHFYDRLASNYHLIFEDWDASMKRQAAALGAILERECGAPKALRVLDCACGIGTQTLGLASLGFTVTACDLSPASVERTRVEAAKRHLNVQLFVADMLDLTKIPDRDFDAVMCMDNALPHLESDEQLFQAATQIRRKLRVDLYGQHQRLRQFGSGKASRAGTRFLFRPRESTHRSSSVGLER